MRICLYGGPGSGKSTTAARLFGDLRTRNYNVELVHEYIKKWAYMKRVPKSFDQVYIFGQQLHAEDLVYQSGVQHLITDSPLYMQPFYSKTYNVPVWNELMMLAKQYEKVHPSLNILLDRTGVPYEQNGRYETAEMALDRDAKMRTFLDEQAVSFVTFKTTDYDGILSYVELHLASPDTKAEEQVKKELKKKRPRRRRIIQEVQDYTEYNCS